MTDKMTRVIHVGEDAAKAGDERWQRRCYGCLAQDLDEMAAPKLYVTNQVLAMSFLSDAQEMLERGLDEEARQYINRAKYVIAKYLEDNSTED